MNKIESFAFCVLSYNHEQYIIEHLESIKFLIETYGAGIRFQLILNDDCSIDNTVYLVDNWLDDNKYLFAKVVRLFNHANLGTCQSVANIIDALECDYWKLTAGDDVYSCENMFNSVGYVDKYDIVSGVPLDLTCGVVSRSFSAVFNAFATEIIYVNSTLLDRLTSISVNNAPNIIYRKDHVVKKSLLDFLTNYDVVEDLPIQLAIAELNHDAKFLLIDKVFVYYRRTPGSTYIVASSRFCRDQVEIFRYLISRENSVLNKIFLKNRLFCFYLKRGLLKKICNISIYMYAFKVLFKVGSIWKRYNIFVENNPLDIHVKHYNRIQMSASEYVLRLKTIKENSMSVAKESL